MTTAFDHLMALKRKAEPESNRIDKLHKLARLNSANTVFVTFGPEGKDFCVVHKDIVCNQSPFLKQLCNKNIRPGEQRKVNLPSVQREHFEFHIEWVYQERPGLQNDIKRLVGTTVFRPCCDETNDMTCQEFHVACHLWNMGHVLQDVEFQNTVMRFIFRLDSSTRAQAATCPELQRLVMGDKDPSAALPRLFVDCLNVLVLLGFGSKGKMESWDKRILIELLLKQREGGAGKSAVLDMPVPSAEDYLVK